MMSMFSAPGVVGDQNEGLRDSKGVISNSPENSNGNHKTKEGRLIGLSINTTSADARWQENTAASPTPARSQK